MHAENEDPKPVVRLLCLDLQEKNVINKKRKMENMFSKRVKQVTSRIISKELQHMTDTKNTKR